MPSLFSQNAKTFEPLAEKLRPKNLDEYVGQEHILDEKGALRKMIHADALSCIILWGPPGTGKTSLGNVIANTTKSNFMKFSAVLHGVAELKKLVKYAEEQLEFNQRKTIVFVDEIHRLNKAQQDAFLPHAEKGTFIMIGATTENPSFTINSALLSRSHVFSLQGLSEEALKKLITRAQKHLTLTIESEAETLLLKYADGDARRLISTIELASKLTPDNTITKDLIQETLKDKTLQYDRNGEHHYNVISAFIKSMRGSDPNAAIYYLARMLDAGEDPRFIARRLVIFASEDIGLADPQALPLTMGAYHAAEKLGMPEIRIPLGHVTAYLAKAPKDNSAYLAINTALQEVKQSGSLPVPMHLRNAPTNLMKEMGYGKGYEYAHNQVDKKPSHGHLPEEIKNRKFFN